MSVRRAVGRAGLSVLLCVAHVSGASARVKLKLPPPPPLTQEHAHPSGAFRIFVPEGWAVGTVNGDPDALQATGDSLVVRFVYRRGDAGYDAFHAACMDQRLTGRSGEALAGRYEYDYVEGSFGSRRFLDSAFVVEYDADILGHRKWRQRNLTVVGGGDSLCLVAFAPVSVWKKSLEARSVLDAVLQNVKFRE
jgi:hypothetical protein